MWTWTFTIAHLRHLINQGSSGFPVPSRQTVYLAACEENTPDSALTSCSWAISFISADLSRTAPTEATQGGLRIAPLLLCQGTLPVLDVYTYFDGELFWLSDPRPALQGAL